MFKRFTFRDFSLCKAAVLSVLLVAAHYLAAHGGPTDQSATAVTPPKAVIEPALGDACVFVFVGEEVSRTCDGDPREADL